jgi:hypothetical protein
MESLRGHIGCAVDSPQRVGEQFVISLQNPAATGIPQAVLNSPLERQNRYASVDLFVVRKLTLNEYSRCTCCCLGQIPAIL